MNDMNKFYKILLNVIPVALMIVLIPIIKNDYILALADLGIIAISLIIRYEKKDFLFIVFGFFIMTLSESIFLKTGTETFNRVSLFGIMPIWLPVLWAYAFMAMKRAIEILNK